MNEGVDRAIEYAGGLARDLRADAMSLSVRVSAWVMAGNGAALLLCLNALLARQVCEWSALQPFTVLFCIGLAASFGSILLSLLVTERVSINLVEIVAAAQTASIVQRTYLSDIAEVRKAMDNGEPEEKYEGKVRKMERDLEHVETLMDKTKKAPGFPLAFTSRCALGIGVLCFAAGIALAMDADTLSRAMCPES